MSYASCGFVALIEFPVRFLTRNLYVKYSKRCNWVSAEAGVPVKPTAPWAPNPNALAARRIRSIRGECLNPSTVLGLRRLDHITSCSLDYYLQVRPHQRKGNKPLQVVLPEVDDPPDDGAGIVCRGWLGGVLKHYEPKAAWQVRYGCIGTSRDITLLSLALRASRPRFVTIGHRRSLLQNRYRLAIADRQ